MIITIDGPTASGKSTIARRLAEELHFYYISSGILFRAVAYALLQDGHTYDEFAMLTTKDIKHYLHELSYHYCPVEKERVLLSNTNITSYLKTPEIDRGSSIIALNKNVRKLLLMLQQKIAQEHDVVVEGRDSGSVVFAHADIKFFVTASERERARRWQADQKQKGNACTIKESLQEIKERDERDATREIAPLIIPKEAIRIDTTDMSLQQVIVLMLAIIKDPSTRSLRCSVGTNGKKKAVRGE
jgi:cytidylate kinase